ncbi:hypothetical protein EJM73_05805 [Clostridium botulinum]|uniref:hypothetical protein n=1 Tax=Clostridium botulinum TaxID=1491 RepID=UPI001375FA17|nr:hypothetical protein [Clostridium botulinum]NCI20763.1 hypothetical protein [Clostridium botulinum]NCI35177.1 hypothetical protein [Clostridium botulinum]NCI74256.1 hypothetical protein [Clostridium botulinum]NDI38344.1 hypothetical protein [Clostridium botulinum]
MYMTLEDRFKFLFGIILIAALFSGSALIMLEISNKYWEYNTSYTVNTSNKIYNIKAKRIPETSDVEVTVSANGLKEKKSKIYKANRKSNEEITQQVISIANSTMAKCN